MKRCPQCRRDYYDDSLIFCLDDGANLLDGPANHDPKTAILGANSTEEQPTAILTNLQSEVPTLLKVEEAEQTKILPANETGKRVAQAINEVEKVTVKLPNKSPNKTWLVAILAGIVAVSGIFGYKYLLPTTTQINSIAVMPFENKNSDADTEYLSDGLAESLIYRLSQLPDLKVSPTSSVFRYKGKESDPQTVAKELGVDSVMTGRITQRGDNLIISVNLVDTRNGKSLWGEQYERKMSELLATQREIAGEITNKLQLKLSGAGEKVLTKQYTTNPEAYQLYLKGNFYRTKYTEEGYKKGLEYYEKAIAIDPNFALAYHGIASAYDFANGWYLPPKEAMPKEKAAALKALELDPTLAETHYLLGKVHFWYEWDWAAAEKQWKRANELDYNYPPTYPIYLAAMGRRDESIKAQEFVQQRLPLDLNVNLDSVGILLAAGRYDQSIEHNRKALELDPNFWWSHQFLGLAYERKKQYPEAIAALEKARLAEANPSSLGYLGNVYAAAGKTAEAQKVLEELKELSKKRYVDPYNIACVYAGLGNKDQAFEWLERAYQERSFFMAILKNETVFDNLQSDPRFKDLLKRMGLPE